MFGAAVAGVLAALLVLGLMVAPAFAQAEAKAGDAQATAGDVNIQYVDCSQVQAAVANQYNSGDAVAGARGISNAATASIAQDLNISQSQVNACLGAAATPNGTPPSTQPPNKSQTPKANTPSASDKPSAGASKNVMGSTIPKGTGLPNTGGASLLSAMLGFGLVAGGMLAAGSIVRRGR